MQKLKEILSLIKAKILYPSSLYTVLISLCFLLLGLSDIRQPAITLSIFLSVLCFSLFLATSNILLGVEKLHFIIRYILHFIFNIGAFILFWHTCYPQSVGAESNEYNFLSGDFLWEINPRQFILGLCLYTIVYILIAGIGAAIKAFRSKESQKEEEYKSIF